MGGTTFETYAEGRNAREAFATAHADACYEYGNGGYTGSLAEKSSFIEIPLPDAYKKKPMDFVNKLIEDDDPRISDKWGPAGCICVSSKDLIEKVPYATTVEKKEQVGARKWETIYTVIARSGSSSRSFASQTEAEKFAKDWVKKTNQSATIRIEKKLTNGDQDFMTIRPKTKDVKVKDGMKKYIFFGWASC